MGKLETKFVTPARKSKPFCDLFCGDYFQFAIDSIELYMKTDRDDEYIRVAGMGCVGKTYTINGDTTKVYDVDIKMEVSIVM